MESISLYNTIGERAGEMPLNEAVFGVKPKTPVIHQVFVALMANQRQPWAHTKDRGDVRGGGKKPWKQKGTGRARHGSIRSPLWKGGGVTFGPLNVRNFKQMFNKKMNRLAVRMILSGKISDGRFVVVDVFPSDGKTKSLSTLREKLPGQGSTTLFVTAEKDDSLIRAVDNIERTDIARAMDVSVLDLMNHQYLVLSKDAVAMLEKRLS